MPGWFPKSGSSPGPPPKSDKQGSPGESTQQFREGLGDHLKARAELLAIETREAGEVLARKGSLALVAATLLFFGYALILVSVVFLPGPRYGNVYVANVSMGANMQQTLKAFMQAESHKGPSLIMA